MDVTTVWLIKIQNSEGVVSAVSTAWHGHVCSDLKYYSATQHHFRVRLYMDILGPKKVKDKKLLFEANCYVTLRKCNGAAEFIFVQLLNVLRALEIIKCLLKNSSLKKVQSGKRAHLGFP